jgi:hypothetical protein
MTLLPYRAVVVWLLASACGCAAFSAGRPAASNPLYVRANDGEVVWERTVDVLHEYLFDIEREDKLGGIIETRYKAGASWLEPWHPDTIGPTNRWQSTLQPIRRKALVSITPVEGGYLIGVESLKEIEDVPNANPRAGRATFLDNAPLQRDLDVVSGRATPAGWVPEGRDPVLEQALLNSLTSAFNR